jgi:hypothetical protein
MIKPSDSRSLNGVAMSKNAIFALTILLICLAGGAVAYSTEILSPLSDGQCFACGG